MLAAPWDAQDPRPASPRVRMKSLGAKARVGDLRRVVDDAHAVRGRQGRQGRLAGSRQYGRSEQSVDVQRRTDMPAAAAVGAVPDLVHAGVRSAQPQDVLHAPSPLLDSTTIPRGPCQPHKEIDSRQSKLDMQGSKEAVGLGGSLSSLREREPCPPFDYGAPQPICCHTKGPPMDSCFLPLRPTIQRRRGRRAGMRSTEV
jgi:hypothetical protein